MHLTKITSPVMNYYKNSLTLYILVVEVTCFTSWPSLSSLTVWSGGCFTFFRSLFDLHCISVRRPRTHNATQSNWIFICLRHWRGTQTCPWMPFTPKTLLPAQTISWMCHCLWMWSYWDKLGTHYEWSTPHGAHLQSRWERALLTQDPHTEHVRGLVLHQV